MADPHEEERPQGQTESCVAQIDRLAKYIMAEVEDEPSQDEGAVDCAIRIMKYQKAELDGIDRSCPQDAQKDGE